MITVDEKKLEDLLGFELHTSTLKLIMTKLVECKEESVPAETMSDIYKVCNKRKTTREGHIDPLCECENLNKMSNVISQAIIGYYKSKEAQEWVNASLGDASLTETERGQMETQVNPLIWWEIIPKDLTDLTDLTGNCVGRYLTKEDAEFNLNHFFGNIEDFRIVKVIAG
ncbi:MAG: hypothetical protein WC998_07565 [Candidatus Paceibacterota bacterium]|jgi:hypothetical protein